VKQISRHEIYSLPYRDCPLRIYRYWFYVVTIVVEFCC